MKSGVKESLRDNFKIVPEGDTITPLSTLHTSISIRVLVGLGAPLLVLLGIRWLLNGGGLLCLFYETTGLYCPGCGSGRAALALLQGAGETALHVVETGCPSR